MRAFRFFLMFIIFIIWTGTHPASAADSLPDPEIREWEIQWIRADEANRGRPLDDAASWTAAEAGRQLRLPPDASGMWVRVRIPPTDAYRQPALLIDRLFGREVSVFADGELLHESARSVRFDVNKLFMPLPANASYATLLIRIGTTEERAGIFSGIRIGEFETLSAAYIRPELPDLALSSGMVMLGLVMLAFSGFLMRKVRGFWMSLSAIALCAGMLIFTYSPLPYMLFEPRTAWLPIAYDLALFLATPVFLYFAEMVFRSQFPFFARLRKAMWGYAALCVFILGHDVVLPEIFEPVYDLFTVTILSVLMLVSFTVTAVLAVISAIRGNWHGTVLTGGIFTFATSAAIDLALYQTLEEPYDPILWKYGLLVLLFALMIILSARIARDHAAVIAYAKERETYNRRLQRAEKMKIISGLAASVAHEIRNPLQVTRGFLQLLSEREMSNRQYYHMAIEELDRASAIIDEFLTIANPEKEAFTVLDIADEMDNIRAAMSPQAALNGVSLHFDVRGRINIEGNASRFRQAIMNFIQNGIDAMGTGGEILVQAFRQDEQAVIRIRDNGSGMDEEMLAKLGTLHYSTKTKGTGLGLMVTFRIIEAMNGSISFDSTTGLGTEVTLRFPVVCPE